MATITLTIEVPNDHPWVTNPGSLVVSDDSAEVILNPAGFGQYTVAHWDYDLNMNDDGTVK